MWEGTGFHGPCHPWAGSPELRGKEGQASHGDQASERHSFMGSASFPAFSSCSNFHLWWTVSCTIKKKNLSFPQWFGQGAYPNNKKQLKHLVCSFLWSLNFSTNCTKCIVFKWIILFDIWVILYMILSGWLAV